MKRFGLVLVLTVLLSFAGNAWGGVLYNVTDLGTLPGYSGGYADGINASGQVVGWADTSGGASERSSIATGR